MLARIRRLLNQFFNNSRTINNEPINKVSLIVIILVDIFILINVFTGLDDISRWYISPDQAYPCYSQWKNYSQQTTKDKDFEIINLSSISDNNQPRFKETYQVSNTRHLGSVSDICLNFAEYKDKIYIENKQTIITINQKQSKIRDLSAANSKIRAQYNSTLLERIAGQAPEQSINSVRAEKARQELEQNNRNISTLTLEISNLKNKLVNKPESLDFLAFIKNNDKFKAVEKSYQRASFRYPSIQLGFQSLFLLPLIFLALLIHSFAQRKRYGLISLISCHLLVIFFIPLIIKIFEFLQIGVIFQALFNIISAIFGGLLFLISYIYILLIPLIGFVIIKFLQKIVLNPKLQAANRVQKSSCVKCAKKIRHDDIYCPYCSYHQYVECQNCHNFTYKHLPYCKQCASPQDSSNL